VRILYLSRNYPNNVNSLLGIWVEGLVREVARACEARVIAPVPYCPPLPESAEIAWFRKVARRHHVNGVEVRSPRFLTGPGMSLHGIEGTTYYWGVAREVDRLRREFPFDLIHAHFIYPDGVSAVRLGRRYGVPVVITDHATWKPWMDRYPRVRRQALEALAGCDVHISVSRWLQETVLAYAAPSEKFRVVPVGFDASIFDLPPPGAARKPAQILYVGRMHPTKGSDVLMHAMRSLIARRPEARLVMVGGSLGYRDFRLQEEKIRRLAHELGLDAHVEFVGMKAHAEVVRYIQESTVLVLPSRRESFGAVLVEALGCGVPVVATRCGGPQEIVTDAVGVLVPPENPEALAAGLEQTLDRHQQYDPQSLRSYAVRNFSWQVIAEKHLALYEQVLSHAQQRDVGAVKGR